MKEQIECPKCKCTMHLVHGETQTTLGGNAVQERAHRCGNCGWIEHSGEFVWANILFAFIVAPKETGEPFSVAFVATGNLSTSSIPKFIRPFFKSAQSARAKCFEARATKDHCGWLKKMPECFFCGKNRARFKFLLFSIGEEKHAHQKCISSMKKRVERRNEFERLMAMARNTGRGNGKQHVL